MRIAYVTETWLPSINGVVTRLVATVAELVRSGHQVLVVAPTVSGERDAQPAGATIRQVPSVGLPFIYGGQPWGLPLPRVVRLLDDFEPDLVHAVCPVLLGWAGVLHARRRDLPLVCSYHTHVARYAHYYHLGFVERPLWALVRRAHRLAHVNLAASEASRDELQARGVRDVGVWRGGVDLGLFHPRHASAAVRGRLTSGRPERRLCLYVGRLAAEKGLRRLLPLARGDRHLALVGDGPARQDLERAFAGAQATFAGPLAGASWPRPTPPRTSSCSPPRRTRSAWSCSRRWPPACRSWPPARQQPASWWAGRPPERSSRPATAAGWWRRSSAGSTRPRTGASSRTPPAARS